MALSIILTDAHTPRGDAVEKVIKIDGIEAINLVQDAVNNITYLMTFDSHESFQAALKVTNWSVATHKELTLSTYFVDHQGLPGSFNVYCKQMKIVAM